MAASTKKTMVLIGIALALGVIGAFLAMLYLNARESALRELLKPDSHPINVVVASKDLLKGDILNGNTLSIRSIPSDFVNDNAVLPEHFDAIEGKVLTQNLGSGQALLHSFIDSDFPLDFSDTIAVKRRAMTIQVDEMSTFTGLLRPGNRIDLLINMSIDGSDESSIVPVLENVEVLTTGRDTAYDYTEKVRFLRGGVDAGIDQNFSTITLNVTPKEAAIIANAREQGTLFALLRNRKDPSGSGYSSMSPDAITANALQMAAQEQIRQSAQSLAKQIVVGSDGILRNADGVALANQDLIIASDGTIRTKSGINLSARGLSINDKGQIVNKDGKVIDINTLEVGADGSLISKDGIILDGPKVKQLTGITQAPDGTVTLADGTVIEGATLNQSGQLVLADGSVVDPATLTINSDGSIVDKHGRTVAGLSAAKTLTGLTVNDNGEVVTAQGHVIKGATLDKEGNLVLANGQVVNPDDVLVRPDGSLVIKQPQTLDGTVNSNGDLVLADGSIVKASEFIKTADGKFVRAQTLKGKLNENGDLVLSDGSIVKANEFIQTADGKFMRAPAEILQGELNENGDLVLSDGSIVKANEFIQTADGKFMRAPAEILQGELNENGDLVLSDGTIVKASDFTQTADGKFMRNPTQTIAGVKVDIPTGEGLLTSGQQGLAIERRSIDYIAGGVSKDGIAQVQKLIVEQTKKAK